MPLQPPALYVAASSHGFGHATRLASVLAQIRALAPELRLVVASAAPRWLIESYLPGPVELRSLALDPGVVQPDSLRIDRAATGLALEAWWRELPDLAAREAAAARAAGAGLVLADIPASAVEIARLAGLPCWMLGNFDWDFIYRAWGGAFVDHADRIAALQAGAERLYRPPLHTPMPAFGRVVDIGLTGGDPRWSAAEARTRWGLRAPRERTALITFGGLGAAALPYARAADFPDWQFVTWDRDAPRLPNLVRVDDPRWRPVDLMPVAGRLIGKPGYSTFAEALRQDLPIVTLPRPGFAEAEILVEGLRDHGWHQLVEPAALMGGDWSFLQAEPVPPRLPPAAARLDREGSRQVAQAVVARLRQPDPDG
ncbi:MAG: glycosyl transferase [Chloroflexi bacterium]|nr:glycosyl transferase [Chloroflexota bacterium]